jgi:glucose/mannose transport system substrate-binding protein
VSEVLFVKVASRRILGLISVLAVVASGCGASVTKVEVVSWWTTGDQGTGFNAVIEQFNKDNPSIQVANSAISGGTNSAARSALLNRVLDGVPPDTFQVGMGHEMLDTYVVPGYMDNLDDLYAANGWTTAFPQGVLDIVSAKDSSGKAHYFSVPVAVQRVNLLWYNKSVFSSMKLTPPTTWGEFFTDADALKAKGYTALAVGDAANSSSSQVLETLLLGALGADRYKGLWTGTTDWSGADVKAALTDYQKVISYVNADHPYLTQNQAADYLIPTATGAQPKAAMTIMGDWAIAEFNDKSFADYGWVAAPGNDKIFDAIGDSFGLPSKATDKEAVKKFLTALGSASMQDLLVPNTTETPANMAAGNLPVGAKDYSAYQKSAILEWQTDAIVPSLEFGAAAPPSWKDAVEAAVTAFGKKPDVAILQAALAQACKDAGVCH